MERLPELGMLSGEGMVGRLVSSAVILHAPRSDRSAAGPTTHRTRSVIDTLDVNDVRIGGGCATAAGKRFE
jgi:hypothetical protein